MAKEIAKCMQKQSTLFNSSYNCHVQSSGWCLYDDGWSFLCCCACKKNTSKKIIDFIL